MKQRIWWIILAVLFVTAIWYFFVRPYHLSVSFNTAEHPEIVYEHLNEWPLVAYDSLKISEVVATRPQTVTQKVIRDSTAYQYTWSIERKNPSSTRVVVQIKDLDNPVLQKMQVLTGTGSLKEIALADTKFIFDGLKNKPKTYRVHNFNDSIRESVYCAYIPLKAHITNKARVMRDHIIKVMGYIKDNDIPLDGDPFLEITRWDRKTDSIAFDFCFPITASDSLPTPPPAVRIKQTKKLNGLKAEFNGNYRDSYKSWYYLLENAEQRGLEVDARPVEVFLNDPHGAGDPLNWKAIIYLPLKN
jgi:effector-binding domain-containing protein